MLAQFRSLRSLRVLALCLTHNYKHTRHGLGELVPLQEAPHLHALTRPGGEKPWSAW